MSGENTSPFIAFVKNVQAFRDLLVAVGDIIDRLSPGVSVITTVYDITKKKLTVKNQGCDPGEFNTFPKPEIEPKPQDPVSAVDVFGSSNSGAFFEFAKVAGHVNYDIDGNVFHIEWDAKIGLDNGCFASITGPTSNRYKLLFVINKGGNTKVPAEFAISENPGPYSVKELIQRIHPGFDPRNGLKSLQPENNNLSLRQLLSI